MQIFHVYPKKGSKIPMQFDRFEINDDQFAVYNEAGKLTTDGYLSFPNIAAIVPEHPLTRPPTGTYRPPFDFRIYLKSGESFDINADSCDPSQPISIRFLVKTVINNQVVDSAIPNVYIAPSEVVAIMPPDGLKYRS